MTTLLDDVVRHLDAHDVRYAMIGATALSLRGVVRSTVDVDLLTVERAVLREQFWASLATSSAVDVRPGDFDDPLAGLVWIKRSGDAPIDVVVSKHKFAVGIIDRAVVLPVNDGAARVAQLADIVLMKLFAGGGQDAWDIGEALKEGGDALIGEVDSRVGELPTDGRNLWTRILAER